MKTGILVGIIAVTIFGTFAVQGIIAEAGLIPIETLQVDGLLVEAKTGSNPNVSSALCPISHPFLIGGTHTFGSLDSSTGQYTITPNFDTSTNTYSVEGIIFSGNGIKFQAHALCSNFNFPMGIVGSDSG